jgi:hypothetical protein
MFTLLLPALIAPLMHILTVQVCGWSNVTSYRLIFGECWCLSGYREESGTSLPFHENNRKITPLAIETRVPLRT